MSFRLRRVQALPLALAVLSAAACSDDPTGTTDINGLPRELSLSEEALIEAANDFAFRFLARVNVEDAGTNVFISPLSASMALGMTMNGAAGATHDSMRATLGFGELSEEEINRSYRDLIDLLLGLDPNVVFGLGNSIWYRQGFAVEPDFLARTTEYFDAEVAALDFADPGAVDVINGWVSEETHGKIDEIVEPPIDGNVVMLLINAIYFNGTWTYEFDPDRTYEGPFTRQDGTEVPVMMMVQKAEFPYTETPDYQVIELPYGGGAFAMTVVLPREGTDIDSLIAALDAGGWAALLAGLEDTEIDLYLPKFKLEWEKKLNDVLIAMGMGIAFDAARADFSRIRSGGGLWIDEVKQKSFVEVDEKGTEAAAATVVVVVERAGPGMLINRPFLFAIRERYSGTILFIGKLVNPPQA